MKKEFRIRPLYPAALVLLTSLIFVIEALGSEHQEYVMGFVGHGGTFRYHDLRILGIPAYFALMAAGGDLGGSVAPQMLGAVVDAVSASDWAARMSVSLGLSTEQIGMKAGMLAAAIFPILGIGLLIAMNFYFKQRTKEMQE